MGFDKFDQIYTVYGDRWVIDEMVRVLKNLLNNNYKTLVISGTSVI